MQLLLKSLKIKCDISGCLNNDKFHLPKSSRFGNVENSGFSLFATNSQQVSIIPKFRAIDRLLESEKVIF